MPPPCVTSCSFCLGGCDDMFPWVVHEGVTSILLDLFVGSARIEARAKIGEVLLTKLCAYKGGNQLMFGIKN